MKKKHLVKSGLAAAGLLAVYSCGGGGGISTSQIPTPNPEDLETGAPKEISDQFTVANKTIETVYGGASVRTSKDAFTKSDSGVIVLQEFPPPETVSYNETANDWSEIEQNLKPIKKLIRSSDKKIALAIDNIKLNKDLTVAITPYKELIALINNGLDILSKGYEPLPQYSFDIAFYDTDGKRIWDLKKLFEGQEFDVYAYFKGDDLTNGTYKAFIYPNYNPNKIIEKDIALTKVKDGVYKAEKIFTVNNSSVEIGPFILAKENKNIKQVNGKVEGLSGSGGIIFLDKDDKTIGFAKINEDGSYNGYYIPPKEGTVKYVLVSSLLQKPVFGDYTDNMTISLNEQDLKQNFFYYGKSTDEFSKDIAKYLAKLYLSAVKWMKDPDITKGNFMVESWGSYSCPDELNLKYSKLVADFIQNPNMQLENSTATIPYNSTEIEDYYNSTKKGLLSYTYTAGKQLVISYDCDYTYKEQNGEYNNIEHQKVIISYNGKENNYNIFTIQASEKYDEKSSGYLSNGTGSSSMEVNLILTVNPQNIEDRSIKNMKIHGKDTYSEVSKVDSVETSPIIEHNFENEYWDYIVPNGEGAYARWESGWFKTTNSEKVENGKKVSFTLGADYKVVMPFITELQNGTLVIITDKDKNVGVAKNIIFESTPAIKTEIAGKTVVLAAANNTVTITDTPVSESDIYSIDEYSLLDTLESKLASETQSSENGTQSSGNETQVVTATIEKTGDITGVGGGSVGVKVKVTLPDNITCDNCTYVWDVNNDGKVDGKLGTNTATIYYGNSEPIDVTVKVYVLNDKNQCIAKGEKEFSLNGDALGSTPPQALDLVQPKDNSTESVPSCE